MSNLGAATQPRCLYLHVLHGGKLKPHDVSLMVTRIEKQEQRINELKEKIENARQAFAETHRDDESRCWAMIAHLSD